MLILNESGSEKNELFSVYVSCSCRQQKVLAYAYVVSANLQQITASIAYIYKDKYNNHRYRGCHLQESGKIITKLRLQ